MDVRLPRQVLEDILGALGSLLESRGHHVELVIVGGATLLLRGVISRPTAGRRRAGRSRLGRCGHPTGDAPCRAGRGRRRRRIGVRPGAGLAEPGASEPAGRFDLVCFKLYTAIDRWPSRDRHLDDLRALQPTTDELLAAAGWTRTRDPSPAFVVNLRAVLASLGMEDGDGSDR